VTKIENLHEYTPVLIQTIKNILKEGWHSIGIICKNTYQAKKVFWELKEYIDLNLVIDEEDSFHQGIVVIPSYLAKGLEFDAVLVVNADTINFSSEEERHILYTMCTRTLHRLSLFYCGKPSLFLREMDEKLYEITPVCK